jgi:choloylglycine hydrolase
MAQVVVWPLIVPQMGAAPPAHLILHDTSGDSAVIEWSAGEMWVQPNPIGVVTNGPYLDWHVTNLRNHLNLAGVNPKGREIDGVELDPIGQGFGMVGLPGDSSPPSRFLRAVALTSTLRPLATGAAAELAALHVLNNFDIPFGFVRGDADPSHDDHTLWSTIADLSSRAYSVRTYDDPVPRRISLGDVDFTGSEPRTIPMPFGGFPALSF